MSRIDSCGWPRLRTPSVPTSCTPSTCAGRSSRTGSSVPRRFGYAAYADRFAGTLQGVAETSRRTCATSVSRYLHLMPLLRPRPAPNDGGYAVMDYREIRPDLGTMDDLRALADVLRADGHQPVP